MPSKLPSNKRPVVADCGDLYRECKAALRAGYRQCAPLRVKTAAAAATTTTAIDIVAHIR